MNFRHNSDMRQKLAAEYVLGTLKGGARRRFEVWMHQDADLRNITEQWRQRLGLMAEFAGDAQPPPHVWSAIERRLDLKRPASAWQFWRNDSLPFWRGFGMFSTGLAAALLVVVVLTRPAITPAISYIATLSDAQSQTALVLTADSRTRALDVRVITPAPVAPDKSLQLWAVPKAGAPRSLGVLSDKRGRFALTGDAISADVALLAVSLEPKGGSPDPNGPTGPILYKGNWVRL